MNLNNSSILFKRGQKNLVGAVNSPVRAFKSVGGSPIFIDRAEGSQIVDVDGNNYLDLVLSYGPMILGHQHPKVQQAVAKALEKGYTFGASTEGEIELAELVCNAFPGMDKVRFVNSGTEAVLSAIRLARAFTGKNQIVKFSGCYHGHSDSLLVAAGSGLATLSLPGSKGVPEEAVKNTLIAQFNDIESVRKQIDSHSDIAAVILEPVAGNMGVVVPNADFLNELRKITEEKGILIIADEVMTGFRSKFGGAQELLGLKADITCLGKVIGGGFPVGAYGAREEIMQMVAPLGEMYQAGTLSGNPIAMACGLSTLLELKNSDPYEALDDTALQIKSILIKAAEKYSIDLQVNHFGSMINAFFTNQTVTDFSTAQSSDTEKFKVFFWSMMERGVFLPPSQFEAWFLSTAINDNDLNIFEAAVDASFKILSDKFNL